MKTKYAGFWVRLLAYYLESHLFLLVFSFWLYKISQSTTLDQIWEGLILSFVIILLPYVFLGALLRGYLTSKFGGNIGKLLTGLRVEDSDHKNLSFKRAFFRYSVGYVFSSVILLLGFLSVIKDPQKRAFHDKIVGSYVIVRQTLWPMALILWIIVFLGNFYFLTQAFYKATSGPLKFEVLQLVNDYNQQKINAEEATMSSTLKQPVTVKSATPSAVVNPSPGAEKGTVLFISFKDSVTDDQIKSLTSTIESSPSVLKTQYLTKDEANQAYKSVSPNNSLPFTNLGSVLIVILKNNNENSKILNEAKSQPFVQAAYNYNI